MVRRTDWPAEPPPGEGAGGRGGGPQGRGGDAAGPGGGLVGPGGDTAGFGSDTIDSGTDPTNPGAGPVDPGAGPVDPGAGPVDPGADGPRGGGRQAGRRGGRRPGPGRGARRGAAGQAEASGRGRDSAELPASGPEAEERARAICLRLLTGTPRTRRQLADALARREFEEETAQAVLDRLEAAGLIDDAAFAGAWVESRHHGRGLARRALARELRTRGVDSGVVDEAVGRLDADTEEETARQLVERKLRATRGLEREKRIRRLAGMLARKGYGEGLALRVVREALEAEGEDVDELLGEY